MLLERRPASGVWGGLWAPPQFETEALALEWCRREVGVPESSETLAPIDHAFTHFDLRLNPLRVRCASAATGLGRAPAVPAGEGVAEGAGEGGEAAEREDRLWYRLELPPKVGLPQPIHALLARMRDGARIA